MSYVMQARSSDTGEMVTWLSSEADWSGEGFPGPGDPEYIAATKASTDGGSGFTAGGDLTGTSTSQTVAKVNGTTVTTAGGALLVGAVLRTTATGASDWGPLNLASSNARTGILPTANGGIGVNAASATGIAKVISGIGAVSPLADSDVSSSAAIAGTKISPNFGSQNIVTTGSVALGTNPATTGWFRIPYNAGSAVPVLVAKDSTAADRNIVTFGSGDAWTVGTATHTLSLTGYSLQLIANPGTIALNYTGVTFYSYTRSAYDLKITSTAFAFGLPQIGDGTPYGNDGQGAVDMNNANVTLASSVYCYGTIKVTSTSAFTAARTLTFPAPASDAAAYEKNVRNTQAGAFAVTLSTGTGTTQTVAQGKAARFLFDTSGVVRLTPDT